MFLGKHLCGTKKTDGENDFIRCPVYCFGVIDKKNCLLSDLIVF